MIAGSAAVKPGVDFEEPIVMVIGPFFYAILANVCYSFGPITDFVQTMERRASAFSRRGYFSR